jgi:hypothetical protein
MSVQLKKQWCFIQLLTETPSHQQRIALLKTLTENQLAVICEIVLNTIQGQLFVPEDVIKTLKQHKTFLRDLVSQEWSKTKKKKAIIPKHKLIIYLIQTVKPLLETYIQQ